MSTSRRRSKSNVACIFVHAGAGYHSTINEDVHIQACNDAAQAAMAILRAGGSAIDAVEIAVKVLEDREITNAGYGSNLTMDGTVECDAIVVDRFGRSGAAGAVAQVKNPISLARLLLDRTTETLSLRRVPPNLLVGKGAADFAYENGMTVLPYDFLISPAAKSRWQSWRHDLRRAQEKSYRPSYVRVTPDAESTDYPFTERESESSRQNHVRAMLDSVWNEAQPISPPPSDDPGLAPSSLSPFISAVHSSSPESAGGVIDDDLDLGIDLFGPYDMDSARKHDTFNNVQTDHAAVSEHDNGVNESDFTRFDAIDASLSLRNAPSLPVRLLCDGDMTPRATEEPVSPIHTRIVEMPAFSEGSNNHQPPSNHPTGSTSPVSSNRQADQTDRITDTVGAIAVDLYGNIACGASSGGIGMKHRGRIGPAGLIGSGAAVIPVDPDDSEEQTTVATVTSGTGEHIGTTMAAKTCSERVFEGRRKVAGGRFEECADDEALVGFVQNDFLAHPSVTNSNSKGEIGVLTVKKTQSGIYFYFAHTTQSFAISSLRSDESKPSSTMSRNRGSSIAQGGRAIRLR